LIPFTLEETSQGALVVSVQFGGAEPQCAWFGGDITRDTGTQYPRPPQGARGIFKARDAKAAAATCP